LKGWIKVPNIARVRGNQLGSWVKRLHDAENTKIAAGIVNAYGSKELNLREESASKMRVINGKLAEASAQFHSHKFRLDAQKQLVQQAAEAKLADIRKKYDELHHDLFANATEQVRVTSGQIEDVREHSRLFLDAAFQKYSADFAKARNILKNKCDYMEEQRKQMFFCFFCSSNT
jgi:hypothetical protein